MDVESFYAHAKKIGCTSLEEVAQAIEQKKFEPQLINKVLENSEGNLASQLAPYILAHYSDELSEKANQKLNNYLTKNQRELGLTQASKHLRETYQQNHNTQTIPKMVQTKQGPALIILHLYGNTQAIAQVQQRKKELQKIEQEIKAE